MQSTGIIRRVDELGRIVLPKDLRRKLQIKEGTCLEIFIDNNQLILKEYSLLKNFEEIAEKICECLFSTLEENIYITDLTKVIVASGINKKDSLNKKITIFVEDSVNARKNILVNNPDGVQKVFEEQNAIFSSLILTPIIVNGDCVGSIIALSSTKKFSVEDSKILQVMTCLISKQMDV